MNVLFCLFLCTIIEATCTLDSSGSCDPAECLEIIMNSTTKLCIAKGGGCEVSICPDSNAVSNCFTTSFENDCSSNWEDNVYGMRCVFDGNCPLVKYNNSYKQCCHPKMECEFISKDDCVNKAKANGLSCFVHNDVCSLDISGLSPKECIENEQHYIYPIIDENTKKCTYNPCLYKTEENCKTGPELCEWTNRYFDVTWLYNGDGEVYELFRNGGDCCYGSGYSAGLCYPPAPPQNCSVVSELIGSCPQTVCYNSGQVEGCTRCFPVKGKCLDRKYCSDVANRQICPYEGPVLSECFLYNSSYCQFQSDQFNTCCQWGNCLLNNKLNVNGLCCNPKETTCSPFSSAECMTEAASKGILCSAENHKCIEDPCNSMGYRLCIDTDACVYTESPRTCEAHECYLKGKSACGKDGNLNCEYTPCLLTDFGDAEGKCCNPIEKEFDCSQLVDASDCTSFRDDCQLEGSSCVRNPCGKQWPCTGDCVYDENSGGCKTPNPAAVGVQRPLSHRRTTVRHSTLLSSPSKLRTSSSSSNAGWCGPGAAQSNRVPSMLAMLVLIASLFFLNQVQN